MLISKICKTEIYAYHKDWVLLQMSYFLSFFDEHFKIPTVQKAVLMDAYCDPTSISLVLK